MFGHDSNFDICLGNRGTRRNPIMEYCGVEVIFIVRIYQPLILNQTAHKSSLTIALRPALLI